MPDDFDELTEEEQQQVIAQLEEEVLSVDPAVLRDDIARIAKLVEQARALEDREIETKLNKLHDVLTTEGVFSDPKMKLLVFTEHKDTLDYLAGDGRDGRPLGKLRDWGLTVTQIHGGMKIGDRDTPGSRINAEREFKEAAQVLVATEAAGEGINLQFCWLMINFDIPWNPVRLEQRVGRIHRYGQEHDCLVINFVAQNTREGRVLQKLLDRLARNPQGLGHRPGVRRCRRSLPFQPAGAAVARRCTPDRPTNGKIQDRIVRDVSPERFRAITEVGAGGLGPKGTQPLGHRRQVGRGQGAAAGAGSRRTVLRRGRARVRPASQANYLPSPSGRGRGEVYRIGKIPRNLVTVGDRQEHRFGRLGREYGTVVFDKAMLAKDATLEWVTPGHPLFEAVRSDLLVRTEDQLRRGAVFYDLHRTKPACWTSSRPQSRTAGAIRCTAGSSL